MPSIVDWMQAGHRYELFVFALIFALGSVLGCSARQGPEPMTAVAKRFIADLGHSDGEAVKPWFRSHTPVFLQRRCPDCPSSRRIVDLKLSREEAAVTLGKAISIGPEAEAQGEVSLLRVGALTCETKCCTWSLGLLDHASVHVERACFDVDKDGAFLTRLIVTDG